MVVLTNATISLHVAAMRTQGFWYVRSAEVLVKAANE